jgi:two-component sensor histidine kinase
MESIIEISARTPEAERNRSDADILLAESNHRIANNLMLLAGSVRLRANDIGRGERPLSTPELQREMTEVAARIETVGMLHRLLSETPRFGAVDFGAYVREICVRVAASLQTLNDIDLSSVDDTCIVTSQDALPLALIVQELVTNSLKYAHPTGVPGRIEISCGHDGQGTLYVVVADDGVGLPEYLDPDTDGSHGFRVVRALVDQLGATIEFDSSPLGLRSTVRLKPKTPG